MARKKRRKLPWPGRRMEVWRPQPTRGTEVLVSFEREGDQGLERLRCHHQRTGRCCETHASRPREYIPNLQRLGWDQDSWRSSGGTGLVDPDARQSLHTQSLGSC